MAEFQDAIGKAQATARDDYNRVCLPLHLRGAFVVEERLVPRLTRMITNAHFESGLRDAMGGPMAAPPFQAQPSQFAWSLVSDLLASREDADALVFFPARILDENRPEARAVFATFDGQDTEPEGSAPNPRFLARVRQRHGPGETVADYAVYRLATEGRPATNQPVTPKLLIHYPRRRVNPCRFPVPADAGWHPRFRAITPTDSHYCGRTFPDGSAPEEHSKGICGENEVTHPNNGIPCSEVWVTSLGETSCVRA